MADYEQLQLRVSLIDDVTAGLSQLKSQLSELGTGALNSGLVRFSGTTRELTNLMRPLAAGTLNLGSAFRILGAAIGPLGIAMAGFAFGAVNMAGRLKQFADDIESLDIKAKSLGVSSADFKNIVDQMTDTMGIGRNEAVTFVTTINKQMNDLLQGRSEMANKLIQGAGVNRPQMQAFIGRITGFAETGDMVGYVTEIMNSAEEVFNKKFDELVSEGVSEERARRMAATTKAAYLGDWGITDEVVAKWRGDLKRMTDAQKQMHDQLVRDASNMTLNYSKLGGAWRELKEGLSALLLPVFSPLIGDLAEIVKIVADVVTQFREFDQWIRQFDPSALGERLRKQLFGDWKIDLDPNAWGRDLRAKLDAGIEAGQVDPEKWLQGLREAVSNFDPIALTRKFDEAVRQFDPGDLGRKLREAITEFPAWFASKVGAGIEQGVANVRRDWEEFTTWFNALIFESKLARTVNEALGLIGDVDTKFREFDQWFTTVVWTSIKDALGIQSALDLANALDTTLRQFWGWLGQQAVNLAEKLGIQSASDLIVLIDTNTRAFWSWLGAQTSNLAEALGLPSASAMIDALVGTYERFWGWLGQQAYDLAQALGIPSASAMIDALVGTYERFWGWLGQQAFNLAQALGLPSASAMIDAVVGTYERFWGWLGQQAYDLAQALGIPSATALIDALVGTYERFWGWLGQQAYNLAEKLGLQPALDLINSFDETVRAFWNWLGQQALNLAEKLGLQPAFDLLNSFNTTAREFWGWLGQQTLNIAEKLGLQPAIDLVNSIISRFEALANFFTNWKINIPWPKPPGWVSKFFGGGDGEAGAEAPTPTAATPAQNFADIPLSAETLALLGENPLAHRQEGGPLGAGEASIVGEGGPEVFVPGQSGVVLPNDKEPRRSERYGAYLARMEGRYDPRTDTNELRNRMRRLLERWGIRKPLDELEDEWGGARRQEGGPVTAGSPYLVGERGPETFVAGGNENRAARDLAQGTRDLTGATEEQTTQTQALTNELRDLNQYILEQKFGTGAAGGAVAGAGVGAGEAGVGATEGGGGGAGAPSAAGGGFGALMRGFRGLPGFGGGGGGAFAGGGGMPSGGGGTGAWDGGGGGAGVPGGAPSAAGGAISGSGAVHEAINQTAAAAGMSPAEWKAIAHIESSLDPNAAAAGSSARGLFQFTRGTWGQHGQGNIFDPMDNAKAAARLSQANADTFRRKFGRNPNAAETYLMHQQGAGFYTNRTMTNVMGNLPPSLQYMKRTGQRPTWEQFEKGWADEVNKRAAKFTSGQMASDQTVGGSAGGGVPDGMGGATTGGGAAAPFVPGGGTAGGGGASAGYEAMATDQAKASRVTEMTRGKTRGLAISDELRGILQASAEESGLQVRVTSGGQTAARDPRMKDRPGGWTGSTRHDVGGGRVGAADLQLYDPELGRVLDMRNPSDAQRMGRFVKGAAARGATGIGGGVGYMGGSTLHVGGGPTATWGGTKRGMAAPAWLQEAHREGITLARNQPRDRAQLDRDRSELNRGAPVQVEGTGRLDVNVNAPPGTRVEAEGGGVFKETTLTQQTQMQPAMGAA